MVLRIKKNVHYLLIILILISINLSCSSYSNKDESNESVLRKALKELELDIAVVLSYDKETSSRLAFIAKNNSKIDITIDEFRTGYNGVEITGPNGRIGFNALQKSTEELITIKSSDTKIWYIDPSLFLLTRREEGVYKIKWNIGDVVESQEFLLLRTNEKDGSLANNNNDKIYDRSKELQNLELNIAVVLSDIENSSRLAFIAINNSKIDITVPEFCNTSNRLEILKPNSQRPTRIAEEGRMSEGVVIKPSKNKIWDLNILELLNVYKKEGLYRIKWKINDIESPEILLLRETDKIENQANNYSQ